MQKPKTKSFPIVIFVDDNIAESQTPAAGGAQALDIDGDLSNADGVIPDLGMGYIIAFTCGGDDDLIEFTIVGTDPDGLAQTEVVNGADTGVSVSALFFRTIDSITADTDTDGTIEVGTVATTLVAQSPTYVLDIYQPHTSVSVNISGTINYTILKTLQRLTAGETANMQAGGLAAKTADDITSYSSPTGGVRFQLNSYSAGATASVSFAQSRLT
jgi:hypothetical protein